MKNTDFKKYNLPDKPGVYFFVGKESPHSRPLSKTSILERGGNAQHGGVREGSVLYIGKATSLKDRVRSYFGPDLIKTRGVLLVDMIAKAREIKYQETDSVLEALILEANLIKKYQPYYNTKEKDDKSFNYVYITPDYKLGIIRGRELKNKKNNFKKVFGPFISGEQLREALKIIRKFFPYIESRKGTKGKEEFYKQIKLSPENLLENKKNIRNIILFFEGKKKSILNNLKKEMMKLAKEKNFEEANQIKRKIFALNHINDIALIKSDNSSFADNKIFGPAPFFGRNSGNKVGPSDTKISLSASLFRIEAYDIAHMSGKNMVGVMVVWKDGELNKNEYRKFIIRSQKDANDTGALAEVLERRFKHSEWSFPSMIVVDGSTAQINTTEKILKNYNLKIPVTAVTKDSRHKAVEIKGDRVLVSRYKKYILLANSEAHRFAIKYHKDMRGKNFLKLRK